MLVLYNAINLGRGDNMKKVLRIVLLIIGFLLIVAFFVTIAYDRFLMNARMFAVPLGIEFTIALSGILFLVPGVICLIIAYIIKRKSEEK